MGLSRKDRSAKSLITMKGILIKLFSTFTLCFCALISTNSIAKTVEDPILYHKYPALDSAILSANKELKYEVLYFFNYNCPSCFEFEEVVENWEKNIPPNTALKSVPTIVHKEWEWAAKMHFYAKKMSPNFTRSSIYNTDTIQKHTIYSMEDMVSTLSWELNVPAKAIERVVSKFDVDPLMKKSEDLANMFDVVGTPTLVLNAVGKGVYKIQPNNVLTYKQMMQLVNGIIAYLEHK